MSWTASLARPLKPRDHGPLATLADARAYILELPPSVVAWNSWQQASKLLLTASENATEESIAGATDQVEVALFLSYRYDMADIKPSRKIDC